MRRGMRVKLRLRLNEKRGSSGRNWHERWHVWGSVIRRVCEMLNASSACMRRRGHAAI